ncbi:MAG: ArnT family glycosyltransferase [Phycisphaerae bacterium]
MDLLLLFALGLCIYTPGLGNITLFDRDEPRFAQAAREMIQRHDYLVPHFNGALRPDKPPLLYWLMDASYWIFGQVNELSARMPSAVCGTLTLLVVYLMVALRFGTFTARYAALILGTCTVYVIESRLATADATQLFFITVCMACAWQAWDTADPLDARSRHLPRTDYLLDRTTEERTGPFVIDQLSKSARRRMPWILAVLFWVALAGGALTKGVPLIFVFVPMIALSIATGNLATQLRNWRKHLHVSNARFVVAAVIAAACVTIVATTASRDNAVEIRWWSIILSLLFILMLLTPRLPAVLFRSVFAGNWSWWRQLRPAWGFPLLIVLVAAWAIPAGMRSPELLARMVGVHFLDRVAGPLLHSLHIVIPDTGGPGGNDAVDKYGQPPGFFLATIWGTFWPWSILLVPAGFHAVRRVRGKSPVEIDPRPYQFLLAWILPMWVLLELSRGKLPHYSLPTFVAIAILCADALVQGWHRLSDVFAATWFAHARWVMLVIWGGLAAAVLIASHMYFDSELFALSIIFGGALLAVGVVSTIDWERPIWPFVTGLTWAVALFVAATLFLPNIKSINVGKSAGTAMADMRDDYPDLQFAALGFEEPTLVFYADAHVEMFGGPGISDTQAINHMLDTVRFAPRNTPEQKYLVVIDDRVLARIRKDHPALRIYPLRRFSGINVAQGAKPVSVTIVTNVVLPKYYFVPTTATAPATLPAVPPRP